MALIGKPRPQCDFGERTVGTHEKAACEINPELPDVVADGASVEVTENARQVRGMNASRGRDCPERERAQEIFVQQIDHASEPARWFPIEGLRPLARAFGQKLERQPLDRQRRGLVGSLKFDVQAPG